MHVNERLERFLSQRPQVDPSAYIAPSAELLGAVSIGPQSSVWPKCVLRADINTIHIGRASNLQDGTIVHLADDHPTHVGDYVTVGHGAILHGCTIEDACLIGMRATILDGAIIGKNSLIGAHTLVTMHTKIPPGSLVLGSPAKVVRVLSEEEQAQLSSWAEKYIHVAKAHHKNNTKQSTSKT
ncbi:MAG: gamma carbonic anhydrase family protein [Opitutales bacterium]|tara:strand:+ start:323 stop:871 length:549 start_codon:yes stop_codon:yes gene_type:complete